MQTRYFYILLIIFGSLGQVKGQQNPSASIQARSRVSKDSVVLRWAVSTELAWKLAHESGYIIERADMSIKNARFEKIAGPLKPWSAETISKVYQNNQDRYAGIALATLYGNTALKETDFNMYSATEMARMFRMRFAYNLLGADQSAMVANMSALRFVDRNVEAGKSYAYRIFTPIATKLCKMDTALLFVDLTQTDVIPTAPVLNINQGDTKLELVWKYLRTDFSAFNLERSADGGKNWKKLNQIPYVVIEGSEGTDFVMEGRFVDTGLTNYRFYRYRISAITSFGESVPFSGFTESYPRDLTPPQNPEISKVTQGESKELNLEWKFSGNKRELKGFKIGRADRADGQYFEISELLNPNTSSFKDENPDASFGNYYMVYAMDTAGNVSASLPKLGFVKDDLPPSTPELISAVMDTTGLVSIIWKPSKASDLMGYRLFTANDSTHEFGLVTGDIITDSFYFDSLTVWSLSKYRFYRLAALDLAYNMSPLSRIIPVRRPDLIPPVPPAILQVKTGKNGLDLEIQGSTSDDVKSQYIEFIGNNKTFRMPFTAKPGERIFITDTVSMPGTAYELKAYAVDSSGNRSDGSPGSFAQRPVSYSGIIRDFNVDWNNSESRVNINWSLTGKADKVAIYRAEAGGNLEWIGQVKSTDTVYSDKPIGGKTYIYCIHVIGERLSVYSKTKEVSVP